MSKGLLARLSHGHGQDGDPGAVSGKFEERTLAIKVTEACYSYLLKNKPKGFKVAYPERKLGKGGFHLWEEIASSKLYAKKFRVLNVDVHFNAGGGDGMEVYCKDTKYSRELGELISKEFKKIGQNYHGNPIKPDNGLQFLKCEGTAVLVECGYVDNIKDRQGFDTNAELVKYGQAIAKALLKYYEKYR